MEYPVWFTPLVIGMPCVSIFAILLVWWRLTRLILQESKVSNDRFAKMFSDIFARTQVLMAQNAEILRRLEQ